jgi:hypothetical protein
MSLTHVDPHVSEIVMVWIQSGDLLMVWIQISLQVIIRCSCNHLPPQVGWNCFEPTLLQVIFFVCVFCDSDDVFGGRNIYTDSGRTSLHTIYGGSCY